MVTASPSVTAQEGAQGLQALGSRGCKAVLASTLHISPRREHGTWPAAAQEDIWTQTPHNDCRPCQDQKYDRCFQSGEWKLPSPRPCSNVRYRESRAAGHLGDDDAIDGRRRLVGAVGAPKLLDGLVCAPGQLQRQVAAPPPVGHPAATRCPAKLDFMQHICDFKVSKRAGASCPPGTICRLLWLWSRVTMQVELSADKECSKRSVVCTAPGKMSFCDPFSAQLCQAEVTPGRI